MTSLFSELRRRNVFKVGTAYLVLGWVVIQITGTVSPALKLPEYTLSLITWLGIIGFPFALLFAWAFELTPQGLRRTEEIDPNASIAPQTGARLNRLVMGLMAAAIVVLLADRIWEARSAGDAPPATGASTMQGSDGSARAEQSTELSSIAVLPFVNMSDDKENEYFGDGLAEELLNLLAKVPQLHVAARTSSFHFKDKNPTIAEVASALDVDTVLEGSVRRSGDTLRVVAQLISAKDSKHLWSEKYDRPLTDIFKLQDDIAQHIVDALMPHLGASAPALASSDSGTISPALFERFLWARHRFYDHTTAASTAARDELLAITAAAPAYAPAWAWLARARLDSLFTDGADDAQRRAAFALAQQAIDTALKLNPGEASAWLAQGSLYRLRENPQLAEEALDKALALDPALVDAHILKQRLLAYSGRSDEAIAELETARAIDPLHPEVLQSLVHLLNLTGRKHEAFTTLQRLYEINPSVAQQMEIHLFADSNEVARVLFLHGILWRDAAQQMGSEEINTMAWPFQAYGLYRHPSIAASVFQPLALALQGQSGEARAALAAMETRDNHVWFFPFVHASTYVALNEPDKAIDLLWQRWETLEEKKLSFLRFYVYDAIVLASLLQQQGHGNDAEPIVTALQAELADWSPLHNADYLYLQAMLHFLKGDTDAALETFQRLADSGYCGDRRLGGSVPFATRLQKDPRFAPILARIDSNYATQMTELKRLESSGMNAEQARAEYLALLKDTPVSGVAP